MAVHAGALRIRDDAHLYPAQHRLHAGAVPSSTPAGHNGGGSDERRRHMPGGDQRYGSRGRTSDAQLAGDVHQRDVVVQRGRIVVRMIDGMEAGLSVAARPQVQGAEAQVELAMRLGAVSGGQHPRAGNDGATADAERAAAERRKDGTLVRELVGGCRVAVGDAWREGGGGGQRVLVGGDGHEVGVVSGGGEEVGQLRRRATGL